MFWSWLAYAGLNRYVAVNVLKKALTVIIVLFLSCPSVAGASPCETKPPIETEQEAKCAAEHFFILRSCQSKHGFTRRVSEFDQYWEILVKDRNPDEDKACRQVRLRICKMSGKVVNALSNEQCAT